MTTTTTPDDRAGRRRLTPLRLVVGAAVVASFGLWVVALARIGVGDPPDTLANGAFPAAAEPRCAAALADIELLPAAMTARSATERAATLDQATDRLDALVGELHALAPTDGEDAVTVRAWLDDWGTYLADRRDYATRLRSDERAEFQLSTRNGQGITRPMDNLAEVNDMPSCTTPGDVG
jgi:hypothetical protein